jgi:hypothetical protein
MGASGFLCLSVSFLKVCCCLGCFDRLHEHAHRYNLRVISVNRRDTLEARLTPMI